MDIILNAVIIRVKIKEGLHSRLKSPISKKTITVLLGILFSSMLISCGGGSGPGDEGEATTSKQNTNNLLAEPAVRLNTSSKTTSMAAARLDADCEAENVLLCESFDWSSNLSYQPSEQDWQLKGWQFDGHALSGLDCYSAGADGTPCALKWVQTNKAKSAIQQKAYYIFTQYTASFNQQIELSWVSRWSDNWQWNAGINPYLSLETTQLDLTQVPVISLGFDQAGVAVLTIAENKTCGREKRVVKTVDTMGLDNASLSDWHSFQLVIATKDSDESRAYNATIQLFIDNNIVLNISDVDLGCTSESAGMNTLSYQANRYSETTEMQEVFIDNVVLSLR